MAYEPPPDDDDTPRTSDRIFAVLANLVDSSLQTGFIFKRWCNRAKVMLETIPGRPLLHKVRLIHLFEADLNLYLGVL
jgi:hypothetical protein